MANFVIAMLIVGLLAFAGTGTPARSLACEDSCEDSRDRCLR